MKAVFNALGLVKCIFCSEASDPTLAYKFNIDKGLLGEVNEILNDSTAFFLVHLLIRDLNKTKRTAVSAHI